MVSGSKPVSFHRLTSLGQVYFVYGRHCLGRRTTDVKTKDVSERKKTVSQKKLVRRYGHRDLDKDKPLVDQTYVKDPRPKLQ